MNIVCNCIHIHINNIIFYFLAINLKNDYQSVIIKQCGDIPTMSSIDLVHTHLKISDLWNEKVLRIIAPNLSNKVPFETRLAAIEHNTTLTRLDLNLYLCSYGLNNNDGRHHLKCLFHGLNANKALRVLKLYHDSIADIPFLPINIHTLIFDCGSMSMRNNDYLSQLVNLIQHSGLSLNKMIFVGMCATGSYITDDNDGISQPLVNYFKRGNITSVDFRHCYNTNSNNRAIIAYIDTLIAHAKLRSVIAPYFLTIDSASRLLSLDSLEELAIIDRNIDFNALALSTSLRTLVIYVTLGYEHTLEQLYKCRSIVSLRLMSGPSYCLFNNVAMGCFSRTIDKKLCSWLAVNKSLRWNHTHGCVLDLAIAMFRLELPPYVLLEIIDWLYPDNPYSTHYKKIMLVLGVYRCAKRIISDRAIVV